MISRKQIVERLDRYVQQCRDAGIRVTPQRTEMLKCLASSGKHPDADTLYSCVRKVMPALSLDTVYRTLRLFEEKGVIVRMGLCGESARFDANTSQHHHFVCTECGIIRDIYDEQFDGLEPPQSVKDLGEISVTYVELRGICRTCHKKRKVK